jgi:hypothetical protein
MAIQMCQSCADALGQPLRSKVAPSEAGRDEGILRNRQDVRSVWSRKRDLSPRPSAWQFGKYRTKLDRSLVSPLFSDSISMFVKFY